MKTIGTDGKNYIINPSRDSKEIDDENRSALHIRARSIIKKCMPYNKCYEEVILTGCIGPGGSLTADFFIPDIPMLIEVHGQQHYKFSKFFHGSEKEFQNSLLRDKIKQDWAHQNDIVYITLPYNKEKEWIKIINDNLS